MLLSAVAIDFGHVSENKQGHCQFMLKLDSLQLNAISQYACIVHLSVTLCVSAFFFLRT